MPRKAKPNTKVLKSARPSRCDVQAVLASLERVSSAKVREDMSTRYGIHTKKAFGVMMRDMQKVAKSIGVNHELALALWDTGWYEARMVASMVDDPAKVTAAQMDRWCKSFDNWAICDTVCFKLFDRTPHAWAKVTQWSSKRDEFVKRTAFALLWALSMHDRRSGDAPFLRGLALIERAADDERNFVKKAVNMALRAVGKRNPALKKAAVAVAQRLAGSQDATARWIGKDAIRELASR
jgi:3-methyladenine DNA glycosylase AlkD